MNFTIGILDYQLNQRYRTVHKGSWNEQKPIQKILLWDGECERDTLYLVPQSFLTDLPDGGRPELFQRKLVLYVAEEAFFSEWKDEREGYFLICPDGRILQAVNEVLNQENLFQDWSSRVNTLAKIDYNFQEMLNISSQYMRADMIIIDRDYDVAAYSNSSKPFPLWQEKMVGGKLDLSDVQELYEDNPNFDETFRQTGLVFYPVNYSDDYHVYYYNISYQERYFSRLLFLIPSKADCPGIRLLAKYLSAAVEECYGHCQDLKNRKHQNIRLYTEIPKLLLGEQTDKARLDKELKTVGWLPDHEYQLIKFVPEGYVISMQTLEYYSFQAEETFDHCLAFQMRNGICCIRNLSLNAEPEKFHAQLPYFLRENLFRAGISNSFSDFYSCYLYAREAEEALLMGAQEDLSIWCYHFSSYTLQYILKKGTEDFPATELCMPALKKLAEYDRENQDSELVKTLYQYLLCRFNASHAADALHIHRTTFLYRMRRMMQIAPLNLDSPEVLLSLLLSFALNPELFQNET